MNTEKIDAILEKYHSEPSSLIQVLLAIQNKKRWLPVEVLETISKKLKVPLTQVLHIATFYKSFSLVPKGKHEVHICMGTACHVRGAQRVLDEVESFTKIKSGETDSDFRFSLETVNCLGCCALGPVVEVDGEIHGHISPTGAVDVLKKYE
jgi:NADH-quinone oxidoreductase subunit E